MVAYDIYQQQCCDFIRLQAWYVWHLHVSRRLPCESIFGNQLVRFLYEQPAQPAWQALQSAVLAECREHGPSADTRELEDSILAQVRVFVDDRYLVDVLYQRYEEHYRQATPFHGFTHDVSGERLSLHFTNTFDPDSPFRHLPELRRGLAELLTRVRGQHHELAVVYCGTWLNSVPRFTDLFPAAWLASAEASPPAGHGGWWGQFTDRTGALHRDNARYLRQTGSFRYPFLRCTCAIDDLARHLLSDGPPPPPSR